MANRAQIHEFKRRINKGIFIFQARVYKFCDLFAVWNIRFMGRKQMQDFNSISLNLFLLGQKKHWNIGCEYHFTYVM